MKGWGGKDFIDNERARNTYNIFKNFTGKIFKTGVSSGKIRKDGKSYRAESQVRKWNRLAGEDRYESVITHKEPAGKNAREKIYNYERERADKLKKQGYFSAEEFIEQISKKKEQK